MFNPYFSVQAAVIASIISLGGAALALVRGWRPIDVDAWADAHGLTLTDESRAHVTRRLTVGRRVRTIGFVIGWLVPYAIQWWKRDGRVTDEGILGLSRFSFVAGYLVAALAVEIWFARRDARPGRAASLEPRELSAYLPPWARNVPWIAAAGALVLVALYAWLPSREEGFGPSIASYLLTAVGVIAVAVVIDRLQRTIVRRRQPYTSAAMIEADDALRSASVGILAGVGIAIAAHLLLSLLWYLGTRTDVQVLRWTSPFVAIGVVLYGFAAFGRLSDPLLQWRVRRNVPAAQQQA